MPDGESFYLNKPGASFQDFAQTTAQILQYIPGYSTIAKKFANNIIKRTLAQTAQAGAVTSVQEAAASALGADNIGYDRIALTTGLTAVFEGVLGPVGRGIYKMFKGNPNYYKIVEKNSNIVLLSDSFSRNSLVGPINSLFSRDQSELNARKRLGISISNDLIIRLIEWASFDLET